MIVWPIFGAFVSPFGWGLIIWLGVRVMNGRAGFMKAVEAAGLANTVLVLEPIVRALLVLGLDNVYASPSAALLIGQLNPGNALHWVLSTLNLMILWAVAVKAIGLARLAGVRFVNAALWAFGIWICYNGLFIGIGLGLRPVVSK
ncbi:MAG: hypothetical protein RMH97_07605 [Verrucomicrobiales bacterium]|nr:hypothetical protein [Verrucomicrobiales bacterium]